MLTTASFDYLKDLSKNNNREWFHANKKVYEKDLKKPFQNLVQELIYSFQRHDPAIQIHVKDAIFRIYRDIRFSKDKTPYKTHVSAVISPKGRKGKEYPGFYIHFEAGRLLMGGGAYFLEKSSLQKVRKAITQEPQTLEKIVRDSTFVEYYEALQGEKNKRLPKEFKSIHEEQPLIANKQFYAMAELDPKNVLKDGFLAFAEQHYLALKPLNDFLIKAIYS